MLECLKEVNNYLVEEGFSLKHPLIDIVLGHILQPRLLTSSNLWIPSFVKALLVQMKKITGTFRYS